MSEEQEREKDAAAEITSHLRRTRLYLEIKKDLREVVSNPDVPVADVENTIESYLKSSGWSTKIQNVVYQQMKRQRNGETSLRSRKEPLAFLQKAQTSWEKKILKCINSMCTDLSLPLARKRSSTDQAAMSSKFTTLGSECDMTALKKIRPVYMTMDFMEAVVNVKNSNYSALRKTPNSIKGWGQITVQLKVKTMSELRSFYKEMKYCGCQYGSFDAAEGNYKDMNENEWCKLGKKVIEKGSCPAAQQYAKSGCPSGLRRHIWSAILDVGDSEQNKIHFEQLKTYVYTYDLLVDTLIKKDVKSTATNDDQYFVFEDLLYQVLLAFTRDTNVLKHFDRTSASPPKSYIRGKLGVKEYAVFYPPNGIIPFQGFSMYAAPLCYMYENPSRLYHVFRELYTRYFFRLHHISSHPQGIVSLCLLFETLLQSHEPGLFYHLRQIGVHPLKTAFDWLFYGFSGYLESEQVLILWDRILGYNSLEILPLLAHSIFSFRARNLLGVTSVKGAEAVLKDITGIKVVPLLQKSLFLG